MVVVVIQTLVGKGRHTEFYHKIYHNLISLDIHKVYKEGSKYLLIIKLVTNSFKVLLEVTIVIDTFRQCTHQS